MAWAAVGSFLLAIGLVSWMGRGGGAVPSAAPGAGHVSAHGLGLHGVPGLSGLTMDADGVLWAIPERHRSLVRITDGRAQVAAMVHGVPDGLDLESIAWLGADRFALGTESQRPGARSHPVLIVERTGSVARVVDTLAFDARPFGIRPVPNQGVEGLCHAGGVVVGALETPGRHAGHRFAAVAWRPLDAPGQDWTYRRVGLTSDRGKLAALDCLREGDRIRVHAVERHYGVSRLLAFDLTPSSPPGQRVEPAVVMDLTPLVTGSPNFEGLVVRGGLAWLITDNHHGRRRGRTRLFRIALP